MPDPVAPVAVAKVATPVTAATATPAAAPAAGAKPAEAPAPAAAAPAQPSLPDERVVALQRKERSLVEQRQALKAKEAEIAKREQDLSARLAKAEKAETYEQKLARLKTEPLAVLEEEGLSYEDLTELKLAGGKLPALQQRAETKAVRDELAQLKREQAERDAKAQKEAAERAEAEKQQAMVDFHAEVDETVTAMAADFPLVAEFKASGAVAEYIKREYQRTGKIPTYKAAIDFVEKGLRADVERALQIINKTPAPPAPAVVPGAEKQAQDAQPRTVTNELTTSTASLNGKGKPRAESERIAAALAALERSYQSASTH